MPLSWNEIRHNAIQFSREWASVTSERAEKQTFWNEFFQVFGIKRRVVASFEEPVKNISGKYGLIDLFWPGILLVEHKSAGVDLGKAESQAYRYIHDLAREGRLEEIPRYIIISDFARIALHDLEPEEQRDLPLFDKARGVSNEFALADFHKHVQQFAFIPGYKQHNIEDQDPVNIEAVELLGRLHDALEVGGYTGHELERFLVRILFCLFAEDTGIFPRESFRLYIENHTKSDGSDLGLHLAKLFEVLDTPVENRQKTLDEDLAQFPYVNGELYSERLAFADFNRDMRNALLFCTIFDWSQISPAIFGSLFQAVMEPKERRQGGGHYTNERDILKVIRSLFLDELRDEFDARRSDRSTGRAARMQDFHKKLCGLHFLDPACGCGNFLVITYRELRQLELEVLMELLPSAEGRFQQVFPAEAVAQLTRVDVDQFYGIEIGEWPVRIAEVAMWLMDHQMNLKVSEAFGQLYQRLPLKKSPHIRCDNALRVDWRTVLRPNDCSYILGNPPFVGKAFQSPQQKADMRFVCGDIKGSGVLDYVAAWYLKAADYIRGTRIVVAFVSTNSITQGEQVGILWNELFTHYHVKVHFGHRTFPWQSEARGKAHVHVVIIGFAEWDASNKRIYDYEGTAPTEIRAKNISPYLVEGSDLVVVKHTRSISGAREIAFGNMPNDGGHLLLSDEEKSELLKQDPSASRFVKLFLGPDEFLYDLTRWCLWLVDASAAQIRASPTILTRVDAVREVRQASKRATTKELARTPSLFGEIRQPRHRYLAIPKTSSEQRAYIPMGFLEPDVVAGTDLFTIEGATNYDFGVLSSEMHMAWVRQVCGRLESRYRYSAKLVYNSFPWPNPTPEQRARVEKRAADVLAARAPHLAPRGMGTLADIYDPLAMPRDLVRAHAELDRAVEKCYRPEPFHSDRERVEYLFAMYEKLTAPLFPAEPKRRRKRAEPEIARRAPRPVTPTLSAADPNET